MASINKITEFIAAIKTIYSYYAKDTDVETLVKTWAVLLGEYPDDVTETAFFKCLQTCKVPPTPADVIEQIQAVYKSREPSDTEMWVTYEAALRETMRQLHRFGESFIDSAGISNGDRARKRVEEIWQELPEKIKAYLGSKGELMRNARDWNMNADYCIFEKTRFLKAMPVMDKRREYSDLSLDGASYKFLPKGE